MFFKTTRGNRISHVGIYVGNGKFIHASSGSGHVQYSSLRETYYRNRFATARRIVKKPSVATPEDPKPEVPPTDPVVAASADATQTAPPPQQESGDEPKEQ